MLFTVSFSEILCLPRSVGHIVIIYMFFDNGTNYNADETI